MQSWIADIREPSLIRLSVDLRRLLQATDPPNRQVLIGCGAFLEPLCQAAAQDRRRRLLGSDVDEASKQFEADSPF